MDFSQFLAQLLALAKQDAVKDFVPPIQTFLANVASNQNEVNIAAQLLLLQTGLVAAVPAFEHDIVSGATPLVEQLLQSVLSTPTASAGASAAAQPAAAA